ncbi:hypothetical protein [Rubinisphaera italica]|uniref:Uncharacterized protein n=1 Tax=Rubinisphaera italica TaxID=2527969 RepID=A0A5C5XEC7_9PLAN|nr:hypothetical protein [Rubinisphaera italica]TWT60663.1 hypothetical protein Pan54_13770 [Rubinisphaera italica]
MFLKLISWIALAATIVPCLLYFSGMIRHETVIISALVGTVVWFVITPLWMGRDLPVDAKDIEI